MGGGREVTRLVPGTNAWSPVPKTKTQGCGSHFFQESASHRCKSRNSRGPGGNEISSLSPLRGPLRFRGDTSSLPLPSLSFGVGLVLGFGLELVGFGFGVVWGSVLALVCWGSVWFGLVWFGLGTCLLGKSGCLGKLLISTNRRQPHCFRCPPMR